MHAMSFYELASPEIVSFHNFKPYFPSTGHHNLKHIYKFVNNSWFNAWEFQETGGRGGGLRRLAHKRVQEGQENPKLIFFPQWCFIDNFAIFLASLDCSYFVKPSFREKSNRVQLEIGKEPGSM